MSKILSSFVIASVIAVGAMGCTSTSTGEQGSTEKAAANAGRAVDDSVITGKVKTALIADSTTKAHQIEVETYQGTVQLSGFVDTSAARSRAAELAGDVEGVKNVKNSLQVRSSTSSNN